MFKLIAVKRIANNNEVNAPQEQIEALAQAIVKVGVLIRPIMVKETSMARYEVVAGSELEYAAAARAKEIDPRKCELVYCVVIDAEVEEQVAILNSSTPAQKRATLWDDMSAELGAIASRVNR